ncbi:hypothetical protein TRBR_13160 [Treponema bryantii]|nr:hypothetical protein TRBR_13160 [Treponema bryantii]
MKKNNKKLFQKIIILSSLVLAEVFGLYAFIKETNRKNSLTEEFIENLNNVIYKSEFFAFDGNFETFWAVECGKKEGVLEQYFSEEKDIDGINANLFLAEDCRLYVMWEKNGILLPYENGYIEGPFEGNKEIIFSEDIRKTNHIVFKVVGENADECRINEIKINERTDCRKYGKITPESYSFNQKEYINIKPERLWDGYVNETWYEPLWNIPSEILQTEEYTSGVFPEFYGHPSKNGEIIWELDSVYKIELLKAYFGAEWRSIAFEFWNGEKWVSKTELGNNIGKGWHRKELTKTVETDRIRITFPLGWEGARHINQIEVWGEGVYSNTERKVLFEKDETKGIYRASISEVDIAGFETEILTEGYDNNGVSLKINEDIKKINTASYTDGKRSVYRFEINGDELREGTQFIEINTYGKKLENILIRNKEKNGRIKLGGSYTDKNRENSYNQNEIDNEKEFLLDRNYSLEKIRIYAETENNLRIENEDVWNSFINCNYNERGFYEADLGGIKKNKIKINSDGEFRINEIELYGSPTEDLDVSIEIWSNQKNAGEKSCLLGWIGNPRTIVTADDSINPKQADNIFWMPVKDCGRNYLKKDRHELKADLYGKTSILKYRTKQIDDSDIYREIIKDSELALSIELPYNSLITQNDKIMISGCVGNGDEIQLVINGSKTDINLDSYQTEIKLDEETNTISVVALDITGRKCEKTISIIKDSIIPEIQIVEPVQDQYINTGTAKFVIDGKEEDLWWQFNDEEWERGYGRYKYKDYEIEDGFYTYSIRAKDQAGNIGERKSIDFCIDKTQPEHFEIKLDVEGWTNNNTPVAQFETNDKTSGIDHYEYKIDDNIWQACESPLQLENLNDGKRILYVKAIDKAGNIREENIKIYVDTSCPQVPENFRLASNKNSIFVKWINQKENLILDDELNEQDNNISYKIERNPEWLDGKIKQITNIENGQQKWEDTEIIQYETYSYRIWAVDEAGNESEKTQWKTITAGFASVEIEDGPTFVDFEGLSISIPENALSDDIVKIQIHEVPLSIITDDYRPVNPLCGEIYSVTTVRKSENGEINSDHADLNFDAVLEIGYDKSLIPSEYDETEIAVFYYDDLWGCWLPLRDCFIDTEKKVVRCKTNHFTEFSVQATEKTVLTEAELRASAYRFDDKQNGNQELNISGEDGGVSVRFEEMFFPGKNGLDLSIQRIYSTGNAIGDTFSSKDGRGINIDGESVWKITNGWKINMPYMKWNGNSMVVYGTDGNCTTMGQMSVISASDTTIIMENHEYSDLTVELNFDKTNHYFLWWKTGSSYKFTGATLYQSDGRKIRYGKDGKVLSISDCTGKNSIKFSYFSDSTQIIDSYDRSIIFNYSYTNKIFNIYKKNINKIISGNFVVDYTIYNNTLTNAKDVEGRDWTYIYENKKLENEYYLKSANDEQGREWVYNFFSNNLQLANDGESEHTITEKDRKRKSINILTGATGPGVGFTKLDYEITNFNYRDSIISDGTLYRYDVYIDKLSVTNKKEWNSYEDYEKEVDYLRNTDVKISFAGPVEKNIYVKKSQIFDGKTTVITEYGTERKERTRLSQAPKAIQKVTDYDSKVSVSNDNIQILTYAKKIKVYDGIIDETVNELYEKYNKLLEKYNKLELLEEFIEGKFYEYDEDFLTAKHIQSIEEKYLIQSCINEIDTNFMRITKSESEKGVNKKTDEYTYDAYGNILTEEHKVYMLNGNTSIERIERTYENLDYRYLTSSVRKSAWVDINNEKQFESNSFESYKYNEYGQMVQDSKGPDEDNVNTYIYNYGFDGQISEVVSPEGCKTQYSYTYDTDKYSTTVSYIDIEGLSENKTSVSEKFIYDKQSGNLVEYIDRDGYITQNRYDKLNRLTEVRKYHEIGESDKDNKCSVTKVVYNDQELTSTVTDALGAVTINTFDNLGRLIKVVKSGNTSSSDALENVSQKAITINLEYDNYDRVIKMTEPSYEDSSLDNDFIGTIFTYDSQNRLLRKVDADKNILEYIYDDKDCKVTQNVKRISDNEEILDERKEIYKDYNENILKEVVYFTSYDEQKETPKAVTALFDGAGRMVCVIDADENKTQYKYNYIGKVSEILYPDNTKEVYTYNKDGNLIKTEKIGDQLSSSVEYKINGLGQIIEETRPVENEKFLSVRCKYDGRGNKISESISYKGDSSDVKISTFVYDWNGKLISETDGENNTTFYEYDANGNITCITDPRHLIDSYEAEFQMKLEYDSFGRVIKGWLPHNEKRIEGSYADVYLAYDAQGNCIIRQENEDIITNYDYTSAGLLKKQSVDGYETKYEYNGAGKLTKVINPDKTWTSYLYNTAGKLIKEYISGVSNPIKYQYDKRFNIIKIFDRSGKETEYEYDDMNRVIKENKENRSTILFSYDELGRVISETDGENNIHTYEYDILGRVVKEKVNTVPEATVMYYEYDARGNVKKFIDAAGTVFERKYSKIDLLEEENVYVNEDGEDVLKETRSYKYDETGALKSAGENGNIVYYNGADSDYQPDAYGNTRKERWEKTGFEMVYSYDKLNRLISVQTPDRNIENYEYNKNNQIQKFTGKINGTLSYDKSKLSTINFDCGLEKTISYNDIGLISSFAYSLKTENQTLNPKKKIINGCEYLYDSDLNIYERNNIVTGKTDYFKYDKLNRLESSKLQGRFNKNYYEIIDNENILEIDRDIDGMTSEKTSTLNGQFFPAEKVTLDEKGKSFVYDFTEEKEIQKIELFKTNLERKSRIRERDLHIYTKQNEADGWEELNPDNWNYVVDSKNQSIHLNLKNTLKTQFIKIRTIWDDRDLDNNNVSDYVTFSNESVQKMIRIWTLDDKRNEAYGYDKNSNRLTLTENGNVRTYQYYKNEAEGNTARVMYDGKWWYTYDANGNRTARARTAIRNENEVTLDKNCEYWEYEWDYHNRLIKVEQYNAPDNAQNVKVEYTYDAMNRRIERVSYTSETSVKTQYAYGRNGAITYQKKTAGSSVTTRSFVYLNNQIAGFLDTEEGTESIRYAVTDIQGSVTEVYDEDNRLLWKSGYTAFGIKAGETTNLIDFDGLYTGCDIDAETGLTYHWNRWRSEDGESWLSEDPIRDGLNWYGYAGQNPINWQDNTGLSTTLDDFNYQKQTADSDKSIEKQREYAHNAREYALQNQGLTDLGNAIHNNEEFFYNFLDRRFDETNPLNQLDLDRFLGFKTNAKTTQSCLLAALFNAYGVMLRNGITGAQILESIFDDAGNFRKDSDGKSFIKIEKRGDIYAPYVDGSKLWAFSNNIGKVLKLTKGDFSKFDPNDKTPAYLNPTNPQSFNDIKNDISHLKKNGWYGILKQTATVNKKTIDHFVFVTNLNMYDSLPANRPNKPDYTYSRFISIYISVRK